MFISYNFWCLILFNIIRIEHNNFFFHISTNSYPTHNVKENETPEIVADKHHGSTDYHWIVMLMNDISDVNHDWVKSTRQLQKYLLSKYTETQLTETHHYESYQTSGDTTIKIEVENTNYPSASIVTNYEYEVALNDGKREINLLRNEYLGFFVDEFQSLM